MKKELVVAVGSCFFCAASFAQSSVTLYGLIDASVQYTNNVKTSTGSGSKIALANGNINGSRWGIRGIEDLGGGLSALFVLENGFSIANGTNSQQGREFGRSALVGLSSKEYGAVTLGRQYESMEDFIGPFSLTGTSDGGTIAAHPYDNDDLDDYSRVNNAVKFTSRNYAGLVFGGLYAFSGRAGAFDNNRAYSGGATYSYGGLKIAGAYAQINNAQDTASDLTGVVSDSSITASRKRYFGAAINYAFGPAIVGFVYTQSKFDNAGAGVLTSGISFPVGAYVRFSNYEVNARYLITPAWKVAASYTYTDSRQSGFKSSPTNPKYQTAMLLTVYALSKRTNVYAQATFVTINGNSNLGGAYITGESSSNRQIVGAVGVRHSF